MATNKKETRSEEIKPIILKDKETGAPEYTLDFDLESIKFAESRGFDPDDISRFTYTKTVELFWYSFRMHHKSVSLEKAERILKDDLGGMPSGMLKRLVDLYNNPYSCLVQTEESAKNAVMTVEM